MCRHRTPSIISETAVEEAITADPAFDSCWLIQQTKKGAWITVLLSKVDRTDLGSQEWYDYLFLYYSIYYPEPPLHCDGYNTKFSICRALDCNKVSLITTRHNEIHDEVSSLAGKAFNPSYMCNDPLIHTGWSVWEVKAHPAGSPHRNSRLSMENSEKKGYLPIWVSGRVGRTVFTTCV